MQPIRKQSQGLIRLAALTARCASTGGGGAYDAGRLNLPFVGHTTFHKSEPFTDWSKLNERAPEVAVLGSPIDFGTQYRAGARFGPRGIREASTLYCFGHGGVYDHERDTTFEYGDMVDVGDVDIIHTDSVQSHKNTQMAVETILESGALPVIMGGDHSITTPAVQAYAMRDRPVHIVQFDAHLDFVDVRHGVRYGHGNCMRRCSEMDHVSGMTQLGIRSVSSTAKDGFDDARARGSDILSVRQVRSMGIADVIERLPEGSDFYVTIDIDGFDPSIAPGTGTPSHGGFWYYEVQEIIAGISKKGNVVGLDVTEVAPDYDLTGSTSFLAARIMLDTIGFVLHDRKVRSGELSNCSDLKPPLAK